MPVCSRRSRVGALAAGVTLVATAAAAHPVDAGTPPHTILRTWSTEPGVIAALAALAIIYSVTTRRRRARVAVPVTIRAHTVAFALGWIALAIALLSPLDAMGSVLFSAHMAQHEVLMIVAAPLLVLADLQASIAGFVRMPHASLRAAACCWLLHAAAIVVWHVPVLFDAAVHDDVIHALQHLSFFGTGLLFWWSVIGVMTEPDRISRGLAVVSVFTTAAYTTALGALLTVTPTPWYSAYATTTAGWGLTPLEDQQLGGLIMWVPGGIVYTAAGLWLFARWLRTDAGSIVRGATRTAVVLALLVSAAAASGCDRGDAYRAAAAMTGGDPRRGPDKLTGYGCATCHVIPGIREARGLVGPPLTSIGSRVYLAGRLPNTPDNILKWIQHPHQVDEQTAMPDTGVTDADARDIAAYLYTLR